MERKLNISEQKRNELNNKIQELEELLITYTFYKNCIKENKLPFDEYIDLLLSYHDKTDGIIDYIINGKESLNDIQWAKCKLLFNCLLKENTALRKMMD